MIIESLDELEAAFASWRNSKKYPREPVPDALIARAQKVAVEQGTGTVAYRLKVNPCRLSRAPASRTKGKRPVSVPAFTRLEITAPSQSVTPLIEVESRFGVKLRVFQVTKETTEILGSFYRGTGGEA